ncbi:hypothetical protein DENSPDRAFT_845895, partial [Dentipellis sp. KUC8613]
AVCAPCRALSMPHAAVFRATQAAICAPHATVCALLWAALPSWVPATLSSWSASCPRLAPPPSRAVAWSGVLCRLRLAPRRRH